MASKRSAQCLDEGPLAISSESSPKKLRRTTTNGDLGQLEVPGQAKDDCNGKQADVPVQGNGELLHLDDPCLLMLAENLSLRDRLSLGEVCLRLKRVCQDPSLWCDVNANYPMTNRDIRKILPLLHDRTFRIAIKGFLRTGSAANSQRQTVSPSLLASFQTKCPQLKELKLTECFVDGSKITIDKFPKTLERLMLPDCEFVNLPTSRSFFCDLKDALPLLSQLDLSGCGWVTNHCLIAICKLSNLEELSLRGCFKIGVCFAYTALACRFGFRTLKKLDLRDTSIGNTEVSAFGRLPELTHLKMGKSSARSEVNRPDMCESDGEITDRGLFSLCPFSGDNHVSKLQYLTLTNLPKVTNRVMTRLATSLPLKRLDVSGTKISAIGADALLQLRPNCNVVLDTLPLGAGEVEAPANVENPQEEVIFLQLQP